VPVLLMVTTLLKARKVQLTIVVTLLAAVLHRDVVDLKMALHSGHCECEDAPACRCCMLSF
jgi:hypothetical protein